MRVSFQSCFFGVLLSAFLLASPNAAQAVTYTYEGLTFTTADPPYSTADRVSGTITVPAPLAPNLVDTDLRMSVQDVDFFDGVEQRTLANSELCQFTVSTDAASNIIDWSVQLRAPFPGTGNQQHIIEISSSLPRDIGGYAIATGFACDNVAIPTVGEVHAAGNWSGGATVTPFEYEYQGNPFENVTPPYSTSNAVSGTLTVTAPFPPFVQTADIRPFLLAFSMTDDLNTLHSGNAEACVVRVATNGTGNIGEWSVVIRALPLPPLGDPHQLIDTSTIGDLAGTGPAGANVCDIIVGVNGAINFEGGNWQSAIPQGTPTTYQYIGAEFVNATAPWILGESIQGTLTLDSPLPPNLPLTSVSAAVVDFLFRDGTQVRDPENTVVCQMELGTDQQGRINAWSVRLRRPFLNVGDPQRFMDFQSSGDDIAGAGPADNTACGQVVGTLGSALAVGPDRWQTVGDAIPVPSLSTTSRTLLLAMLAILGVMMLRNRW